MSWWNLIDKLDGRKHLRRKLYNMSGSAASWDTWNDPTNIVASQADPRYWERQGIWYPGTVFPMGGSVDIGVTEHLRLLDEKDPDQEWVGLYYSQSGMIAHRVWKAIQGTRHAKTMVAMIIFGPPDREKNVANGNKWAGLPLPAKDTRGISDDNWVDTPDNIFDFVNRGDIYGEVADDDAGEDMTMIFRIVQNPKAILTGKNSGFEQMVEIMKSPLLEGISAVKAIWKGLMFVGKGPWPTYPHTSYQLTGATDGALRLVNEIGSKWPVKTQ